MITKEEYLAMASAEYDSLKELEGVKDFYDYEKTFSDIWQRLGRRVLESSISTVGNDRRKKKQGA